MYYTTAYDIISYSNMTYHAKQNRTVSWQTVQNPTIILTEPELILLDHKIGSVGVKLISTHTVVISCIKVPYRNGVTGGGKIIIIIIIMQKR